MEKMKKLIAVVALVAKYASVLIILGQTFEFLQKALAEKFPADSENIK